MLTSSPVSPVTAEVCLPDKIEVSDRARQAADEAVTEKLHEHVFGQLFILLGPPLIVLQLAIFEWMRHLFGWPPQHIAMTMMALLLSGYAAYRIRPIWQRIHQARDVKHAEWQVATLLRGLAGRGFRVAHDVRLRGGVSFDYVVVGPGGVFAVDTDTSRVPRRPEDRVEHRVERDGSESLVVSGLERFGDPLGKLHGEAHHLKASLRRRVGRDFPVVPTLVFPGWEVVEPSDRHAVLVTNERLLEDHLCSLPKVLEPREIDAAVRALNSRASLKSAVSLPGATSE